MSETEQTAFWRGDFGDEYAMRNVRDAKALRERTAMWARVLAPLAGSPPSSILEVGANIGINMAALGAVTGAELHAVEPNAHARAALATSGLVAKDRLHDATGDKLPFPDRSIDMVFTSGVLIHVAPERLEATCREMHRVAGRYIGCIEYFSVSPEEKSYRGHSGKLFKRDFGGYWWDLFPEMRLAGYGFFWKRVTGLDDLTWWVFEKR
jgi:pseudaminic acid biosynthesis-associated methylase